MIEKLKNYLISIFLQKYLPIAGMAAITALGSLMAAHAGMLEQWGVNYIPNWSASWLTTHDISGQVILIELDTLSKGAIVAVTALVALLLRATEHHVATAVSPDSPPPAGKV